MHSSRIHIHEEVDTQSRNLNRVELIILRNPDDFNFELVSKCPCWNDEISELGPYLSAVLFTTLAEHKTNIHSYKCLIAMEGIIQTDFSLIQGALDVVSSTPPPPSPRQAWSHESDRRVCVASENKQRRTGAPSNELLCAATIGKRQSRLPPAGANLIFLPEIGVRTGCGQSLRTGESSGSPQNICPLSIRRD